ncbi:GL22475 [Drosophila persimilis]|uniref:GL22475 n=1 Tax=Drosophila persimilis TaxID=7234 RepID=B4H1H5_DROPE|nr:GL22475 [Drosophila persimilis]
MEAAANKSPQQQQQQHLQHQKKRQQHRQQQQQQQQGQQQQGQWSLGGISTYHCLGLLMVVFGVLSMLLAGNCVNGAKEAEMKANRWATLLGEDYPAYDAVAQGSGPSTARDASLATMRTQRRVVRSGTGASILAISTPFLCPNGTVFNQAVRVCDWWSNVNCASSEQLYQNNDELYRIPERKQQQQQQQQQQNDQRHQQQQQHHHQAATARIRKKKNNSSNNQKKKNNSGGSSSSSSSPRGMQRYNTNQFENDAELKDYKSKIKNKYNIDYDHSLDEEYEIIEAIE